DRPLRPRPRPPRRPAAAVGADRAGSRLHRQHGHPPGRMILSLLILAFVTLQRRAELVVARRNTRRLLARGAVESGAEHYPIIVGLHAAWLAGLWWMAWDRPAHPGPLTI